ncbi:hypothetical protein DL768_001911 [Monosporascus sp. mg162]|nr:hypothetical protein DL768_001911 [Monosporascus sp. mg162]
MWKTAFWVALASIGYTGSNSDRFTATDEARMATNVITNVKDGPMAVISGLTKGTVMLRALEKAYGSKGIDEQFDLWTQLQFLHWNAKKDTALDHVVEFQRLVRRIGEVTLPTTEAQQIIIFINSLRNNKTLKYGHHVFEGRFGSSQFDLTTAKQNDRDGKPNWNKKGKPLCWNCGKYGHKTKDCPKRKGDDDDDDDKDDGKQNGKGQVHHSEVHFIPDGLEDLYNLPSKKYQAGY